MPWLFGQNTFRFEEFDFFFDQGGDAMLGQVDARRADLQGLAYFRNRPLAQHVEVENLKLLGIDLCFDSFNGGLDQVLLPLLIPYLIQVGHGGVGNPIQGAGLPGIIRLSNPGLKVWIALAKLIGNPAPSNREEPLLKGAFAGVILEIGHAFTDGDHRFLHRFLSFGFV